MIDLTNKSETYDYVISHIDDAIANEWIKVYYQPVIRALTGQLCGAESLARWIDPEVGFLSPDKFIGALESHELIHKLDCFVVDKVCSDIREHLDKGLPTFPVSINFSRHDFMACDMLGVVETAIDKYDIPRDYLHIEITESMIAQDEALMTKVIESFRARGYEVWMDDFGSGYSSLTLLQDYPFDLLKLDMRFLSTMTDKSKTIITSVVDLAKHIGIKTLSEGVETQEQIDFLTNIGCGKLQGYYFSKPMPYDEMLAAVESKNITIEERKWRDYYETACLAMYDMDRPLQIVEYDGNTFNSLFINAPFKQQISMNIDDLKYIDRIAYNSASPEMEKFKKFAAKLIQSKGQDDFYFTLKGNYFQLRGTYLAENEGRYLFKSSIQNISIDQNTTERDNLDRRLRELNHLYEMVLLINPKEDLVFPLLGGYVYGDGMPEQTLSLAQANKGFGELHVHPDDRSSFIEFMEKGCKWSLEIEPGQEFMKKPFRIKQHDGSYKWRELALLPISGSGGREYLFTVSALSEDLAAALDNHVYADLPTATGSIDEKTVEYARLWYTIINNSAQKFFWKDKDRRFRGVSNSFLEFYEINSPDDIIGKNDEEMHWHVDDGPYQGDELDILSKGKMVFNVPGQCIVNGVVHNIICNKMPIYDKGEIIGLAGSFADVDQELYRVQKLVSPSKLDTSTRLMNNKFFLSTMVDYATQFNETGKNYGYIILHSVNHHRIEETYGAKVASKVLREIGEKIIDIIGQRAVASRTKEAYFSILGYIDSKEKLEEMTKQLKEHIEEINQVDGKSVTIKITIACALRTDEGVTDETIHQIVIDRIDELEKK